MQVTFKGTKSQPDVPGEDEIRELTAMMRTWSQLETDPARAQRLMSAAVVLDPEAQARIMKREITKKANRATE